MAEQKKPAARKTAAKKSPAKRKPAAKKPDNDAEVQALENKVAALEAQAAAPPATNPQRFIRNITGSLVRFKLDRHPPQHRGITLQARGNRGDIQAIQPEDVSDPIFQANLGRLFEVITAEEAANAVVKQTTNQQAVHPALALIKNQKGEGEGEMKLNVDAIPFEQQGVTVAHLEDGQVAFDRSGIAGRARERGESPGTPGYISGAEPQHAPANEDPSYLSDSRAREKANTDLGLNVTVAPVQREGIISDGFKSN